MVGSSSSSSGSRSPGPVTSPVAVKPEPQETSLRRHSRHDNLIINEGRRHPSPPRGHLLLVKPKKELAATVVVKQDQEAMVADLDAGLKWLRDDHVREEMERHHRALEEIAEQRHNRDEGGVIVLSDSDEETPVPTKPVRNGDPRQGCSKDGGGPPSDDDDNDNDNDKLLDKK
ncbi:putative WRKY transcription factor 35 [Hordeum vulgare]|nr:putative WRKY transcription factor 35 [Hordeum vulgare]